MARMSKKSLNYRASLMRAMGDMMIKPSKSLMPKKKKLPKTYKGKSTKLGHGGRAQMLKDKGVPEGVIGAIARKKEAAPGQKNYHGE